MTTMQERMDCETRRFWFARLLDRLLEPSGAPKAVRLDPRLLPPYLQRDMGLRDADGDCRARLERPPARW
jgi:hypothetical protein